MYYIELTKYVLVPLTDQTEFFQIFLKTPHGHAHSEKAISSSHNALPIFLYLKVTPLTN